MTLVPHLIFHSGKLEHHLEPQALFQVVMATTDMTYEPLQLVPEEHGVGEQNKSNGTANGNSTKSTSKFDPTFTQAVVNATGPKASPRIRKVFASLITHLHDFARENEITVDEWMAGVEMCLQRYLRAPSDNLKINEAGRMSDDRRNEGQLVCDVLGLESLVDEITYKLATDAADEPTTTAILGPFWRKDAPRREMGETTVTGIENGDHTFMHGTVTDYLTGKPIEGAELDVWHTAPNGLYEQQDPDQVDMNLRGRFTTGKDGKYNFYCLRPTSYPIPYDGPAGKILQLLDRHPMRPAHIHFIVSAPGYKPIVTQIFDRRDKHITDDAVFAVKESLIVDFLPRKGDPKADFELPYNFKMATYEEAKTHSLEGTTETSAPEGSS
ncbi:hypothetical protein LTR04_001025 [Oleoguttula sp. CCFEE 6159]|nr:hypothetical protein LTR04_001025 [Oleoguttula sp. CCFEE 6159]